MSHQPSKFLTLPLEVREQIYTYLCGNQVIRIRATPGFLSARTAQNKPIRGIHSMLLISRQVTRETTHIIYSTNQFHFLSARDLRFFNDVLPAQNLASVRSINLSILLRYPSEEWHSAPIAECNISQLAPRMCNLVYFTLQLNLSPQYGEQQSRHEKLPPTVLKEVVRSSTAFPHLKQGTVLLDTSAFQDMIGEKTYLAEFVEKWLRSEVLRGKEFLAGMPMQLNEYTKYRLRDPYDPSYL